ncbi:hypothetical protein, conserved [Angomonas deanei]|uniref:Uncharacterized protein n=1 Tax=Angomonas deanei TaxID=59799 RepID=A0A7G2CEX3_9TRYP|nr:hypothetical protein, conserved [Angomonas deanei]
MRQQLLLQTLHRDGKVNHQTLGKQLRGEAGVGQLGRQEHGVGLVVRHILAVHLDQLRLTALDDLLLQNGVEHGVHLLGHVLNNQRTTLIELLLQIVGKSPVVELHHLVLLLLRSLPDPNQCLTLGINHQRELVARRDHDGILHRVVIGGETLQLPVGNGGLIHEELDHVEVRRDGQSQLLALGVETLVQ